MRYTVNDLNAKIRSYTSHLKYVGSVLKSCKKCINGVKGSCCLINTPHFDMVWGFPVDSLHCIYLGVTKQFWEYWTNYDCQFYLPPKKQKEINERIKLCKLPEEIHREFRPFKPKIKHKGTEMKTWLLFLSIPCLEGILSEEALLHFSILVKCVFILNKISISEENLINCYADLFQFVRECQLLYGKNFMTFTIHSLLHMCNSVRKSGPLWSTSMFEFESMMHEFQQYAHSPKGVDSQVVKNILQKNILKWHILPNLPKDKIPAKFLENLLYKNVHKRYDPLPILSNEKESQCGKTTYHRSILKGVTYTGMTYCESFKKCDAVVILKNCKIIEIVHFYKEADNCCYLKGKVLKISNISQTIKLPHLWKIVPNNECMDEYVHEPLINIDRKCVYIDLRTVKYVGVMPNNFEVQ